MFFSDAENCILSTMQMKALFEKVRSIEIPLPESEYLDLEKYDSPDVKKLFYLADYVSELQNQLNLLSHDKQKLQSTVTTQTLAFEQLKEEVDKASRNQLDSEKMKKDLSEVSFSLVQMISLLGSNYNGDSKSDGLKGLVRTLGKQIQDMLSESENSKTKFEELSKKLIGSQKVVDELNTKNKLLEESLQGRTSQPEIIKERSIFEAPSFPSGSEISEIEDAVHIYILGRLNLLVRNNNIIIIVEVFKIWNIICLLGSVAMRSYCIIHEYKIRMLFLRIFRCAFHINLLA